MIQKTLAVIFERELNKLIAEINLYKNEESLWIIKDGISNSAGNLCLHLTGNLNHFIGATLGNTGYIRQRDDEFSLKNIPRKDLILNIENCIHTINAILNNLPEAELEKDFPLEVFGGKIKTEFMLVHLATHLSYHLGQINYHRRLLS